jgi:lipopolysaccharide biosynthesis glycosyltransferase
MINVFIGYDEKETIAYHAAVQSIMDYCSEAVSFTPLNLTALKKQFWRQRDPLQSTDFSFSRFLVPHLCQYQGWALFMDCDMIVKDDLAKLWALRNDQYAVQVVQHDYQPKETTKFLGQPQTLYHKKNWSSVMLFNNALCKALSPEYVNSANGLDLHRFNWLESESLIGALPKRWNWLVDYDATVPVEQVSLLHYTSGGPYFKEYQQCSYHQEWFHTYQRLKYPLA